MAREILKSKLDELVNGKASAKQQQRAKSNKQKDRQKRRREAKLAAVAQATNTTDVAAASGPPQARAAPRTVSRAVAPLAQVPLPASTDEDHESILNSLLISSKKKL